MQRDDRFLALLRYYGDFAIAALNVKDAVRVSPWAKTVSPLQYFTTVFPPSTAVRKTLRLNAIEVPLAAGLLYQGENVPKVQP